jgi:peptidoglycan hydrolase-like protein with peptidoglycan-binding domain
VSASRRRRRAALCAGIATLGTIGAAGFAVLPGGDPVVAQAGDATSDTDTKTAEVQRRDLVDVVEESGTLGYPDAPPVRGHRGGTLTATSEPGAVIERGQPAFFVDGRAVPILYGTVPMWRRLDVGAEGVDVEQLEANLVAMGYATEQALGADGKYDARTATAVKKWQKDLGVDQTGVVEHGDFEFTDGPIRVAKSAVEVGEQVGPGAPVLEVTRTTKEITVELDASRQSLVSDGEAVEVELPDGSVVSGTVAAVGRVATADDSNGQTGTPKIEITISLDDPAAGGALDSAPVTVRIERSRASGVLAVPVRTLLALAEGGYAVEIEHGGGRQLVAVELGAFADGWVEISGNVREGDTVVSAP